MRELGYDLTKHSSKGLNEFNGQRTASRRDDGLRFESEFARKTRYFLTFNAVSIFALIPSTVSDSKIWLFTLALRRVRVVGIPFPDAEVTEVFL
jgi:hypothetical protein